MTLEDFKYYRQSRRIPALNQIEVEEQERTDGSDESGGKEVTQADFS